MTKPDFTARQRPYLDPLMRTAICGFGVTGPKCGQGIRRIRPFDPAASKNWLRLIYSVLLEDSEIHSGNFTLLFISSSFHA